jgi:hypothetical protein
VERVAAEIRRLAAEGGETTAPAKPLASAEIAE